MSEQEKNATDSSVWFGACQLDVKKVQLWRDSQEVKLTGKAFAVLCYFVQRPRQLVTKDDLFAAAWPETVVSDATLASCIQEVRQALGDEAKRPRYIETVHRRGFRFIAAVTAAPVPSVELRVPSQEAVISRQEFSANGQEVDTVMPAQLVPGSPRGAGIQGPQAQASGESSWIPAFAGMTSPSASSQTHNLLSQPKQVPDSNRQTLDTLVSSPSSTTRAPRRFRWWQVLVLIIILVLGGGLAANWRLARWLM